MIDDAAFDIVGKVAEDVDNQELNTKNDEICKILKTATAANAQGLDGIKDILNVKIKTAYSPILIVSQSMYNALDKVKDKEGRYML